MVNSPYLDIAIGMVFIFLLYSILATAIQEVIATLLKLRGRYPFTAIQSMLADKRQGNELAISFRDHPLMQKINYHHKKILPSYISSRTFSIVLQDILPHYHIEQFKPLTVMEKIRLLPDGELKRSIMTYTKAAGSQSDALAVDGILQEWFDVSMERLSGVYKRLTQYSLLVIGLALAIAFNINSIAVFSRLSSDRKAREQLVSQAVEMIQRKSDSVRNERVPPRYATTIQQVNDGVTALSLARSHQAITPEQLRADSMARVKADSILASTYQEEMRQIKQLLEHDIKDANNTIGIGWSILPGNDLSEKLSTLKTQEIVVMCIGWLITALAITLGSPFWFDLLQKLVRVRGTGNKPLTYTEKQKIVLENESGRNAT